MFFRRRNRVLLAVLLLAAAVLVTMDLRGSTSLDQARAGVAEAFAPVQATAVDLSDSVTSMFGFVGEFQAARRDRNDLLDQIGRLEQRHRSITDLERENDHLRDLLDLRRSSIHDTVAARVVGLSTSNFEWSLTLDVGASDGVTVDAAVINEDGLVGRVVEVSDRHSRVLLLIDPTFGAAARLAAGGVRGPLRGSGAEPLLWQPFDPNVAVAEGDELVTSSYATGVFPGGIPIGTVSSLGEVTESSLTRDVYLVPYVNFAQLQHVLVITPDTAS